jgi:hypothetical protein
MTHAFARVEANEDVVVTAVSSNTLEVGPKPVEERKQHVAPFDCHFTEANSRFVVTEGRRADGHSANGWTYSRAWQANSDWWRLRA